MSQEMEGKAHGEKRGENGGRWGKKGRRRRKKKKRRKEEKRKKGKKKYLKLIFS